MINDKLKRFSDTLLVSKGELKDYVILFSSLTKVDEENQKEHFLSDSLILLYTKLNDIDTVAKFTLKK